MGNEIKKVNFELDHFLFDIMSITNDLNMVIWLEAGTLLGFMRGKNYIPWERDLDFGMWKSNFSPLIYRKLKSKLVRKKYLVSKKGSVITISKPESICHADINLYHILDKYAVVPLPFIAFTKKARLLNRIHLIINSKDIKKTLVHHKISLKKISYFFIYFSYRFIPKFIQNKLKKHLLNLLKSNSTDSTWVIPKNFFQAFSPKKFRNIDVLIPNKAESYLAYRYGLNWRVPKKDWNPLIEDGTLGLNKISEKN